MKKTNDEHVILCLDIGNTSTTIGISRGSGMIRSGRVMTSDAGRAAAVRAAVRPLLVKTCCSWSVVSEVVVCSVVPGASAAVKQCWPNIFPRAVFRFLGKDIPIPVRNAYAMPRQVGKDRLANAVAAKYYYRLPAIIVDFGTAVTIDIVSVDAEYVGGLILPGLQTSLNALFSHAALLPKIALARPRELIGRDTAGSMLSGVVYGTGFGVAGILDALKNRFKTIPVIIGTGGQIKMMQNLACHIDVVDPLLTLKGIEKCYLASKNKDIRNNSRFNP